jgi:hypothetical protein
MVFPLLDASFEKHKMNPDIAGSSCLKLFDYMRDVILQDAAILMNSKFSGHSLFSHPVFHTSDFKEFQIQLVDACRSTPTPDSILLHNAMPCVAESIDEFRNEAVHIRQHLLNVTKKLDDISSSLVDTTNISTTNVFQQLSALFAGAADTMLNVPMTAGAETNAPSRCQVTIEDATDYSNVLQEDKTPHRMSRQLTTVKQAWDEFHSGLDGRQSIRTIEKEVGAKWRNNHADTQFYLRRKPLFDSMDLLMEQGFSEIEALSHLQRLYENYKTLRSFTTFLGARLRFCKQNPNSTFLHVLTTDST